MFSLQSVFGEIGMHSTSHVRLANRKTYLNNCGTFLYLLAEKYVKAYMIKTDFLFSMAPSGSVGDGCLR